MLKVTEDFDLKKHNTFDIAARCRYFVEGDEVQDFLGFAADYALEPDELLVMGGGSNLLFTADFPGVVFYPTMKDCEVIKEDDREVWVRVGAGMVWDDFVCWCVEHGYGGVENLSLIPGHVGATPVQNIGAYGVEVGGRILRVEAIDLQQGVEVVIEGADCRFGYRDSVFKRHWKNRFIVTYVHYRLDKEPCFCLDYGNVKEELSALGGAPSLVRVREAIVRIRESKLPEVKTSPNAGSFFKNPIVGQTEAELLKQKHPGMPLYPVNDKEVKLAAGWLIEQTGWKGKAIGQAAVHDRQALVLINRGGATGLDVVHLANEVKKAVFMKFGVWLEPEVNMI